MIIWISLIIPLIGAFIMLRWFRQYLAWWEVAIPILGCLLFTFIFKFTVEMIQTSDTEYWSALVQKAEYYEGYTTWVSKTCSRTVKVGKTTTTVYYDCSYCDENGPEWAVVNDIGERFYVSQQFYENLRRRWNATPQFIELDRDINYHGTCGVDGDKYEVYWDKKPHTSEQTVSSKSYENRIQASHSAFDFPEVTEEDVKTYKLYEYPKINGFSQEALIGEDSIHWLSRKEKLWGEKIIEYSSGYWGPKVHGKVWVLLYKDCPQTSALMQEAYWDGGNNNDLVICIGLSSKTKELQWTKVFSWTTERKILVDLREDIMNTKYLNFTKISEILDERMPNFKRKDFKEFSYITIEPPTWAVIVTFIVTILLTIGLCYWAIVNEYVTDETDPVKRIDNNFISGKDKIIRFFNSLDKGIRETCHTLISKIKKLFKNGY
jgi:hypothetical protein